MYIDIDELNINKPYKDRSEPYEQYFGVMDLSKRQIRERILLAEDLEDIFFEFYMFMLVLHDYGIGYDLAQAQLEEQYRDKMYEYLPNDGDFILWYAAAYAANAVDTTAKHLDKLGRGEISPAKARQIQSKVEKGMDVILPSETTTIQLETEPESFESSQADSWYVSIDRAKFNAENEANTVLNKADYNRAVNAGYIRKRWLTMADEKVRATHREVNGVTIPIDGVFVVGDSLFDFPKSLKYNPSPDEYVNCRCGIMYLK